MTELSRAARPSLTLSRPGGRGNGMGRDRVRLPPGAGTRRGPGGATPPGDGTRARCRAACMGARGGVGAEPPQGPPPSC